MNFISRIESQEIRVELKYCERCDENQEWVAKSLIEKWGGTKSSAMAAGATRGDVESQ